MGLNIKAPLLASLFSVPANGDLSLDETSDQGNTMPIPAKPERKLGVRHALDSPVCVHLVDLSSPRLGEKRSGYMYVRKERIGSTNANVGRCAKLCYFSHVSMGYIVLWSYFINSCISFGVSGVGVGISGVAASPSHVLWGYDRFLVNPALHQGHAELGPGQTWCRASWFQVLYSCCGMVCLYTRQHHYVHVNRVAVSAMVFAASFGLCRRVVFAQAALTKV